MFKNYEIVIIILVVFTSSMKVIGQENFYEFDLSGKELTKSEVFASDIANDISYVALETKPGAFISRIAKLELVEDRILVLNNTGMKRERLLIFDRKGKFLSVINQVGKGPGEYTSISDFTYNPVDKTINILDSNMKKVLVFSLEGRYIKETLLDYRPNNLAFVHPNNIACFIPLQRASSNTNGELINTIIYDENYQEIKKVCSPSSKVIPNPHMVTVGGVGNHNGKVSFKPPFDNVIYTLDDNFEYETHCIIDFGKNKIPDELYSDIILMRNKSKNYKYLYYTAESKDYFFIKYKYKGEFCLYFFNKPNQKLTKLAGKEEAFGIVNDIDGSLRIFPKMVSANNTIVCYYNAIDLLDNYRNYNLKKVETKFIEHRNNLLSVINDLSEESNPVIQIVNLK